MRSDSQEVSSRSFVETHESLGLSRLPDAIDWREKGKNEISFEIARVVFEKSLDVLGFL